MTYPVFTNAVQLWPGGTFSSAPAALDDLTDADTTTTAPADGALLAWHASSVNWRPAYVVSDIAGDILTDANGNLLTVL